MDFDTLIPLLPEEERQRLSDAYTCEEEGHLISFCIGNNCPTGVRLLLEDDPTVGAFAIQEVVFLGHMNVFNDLIQLGVSTVLPPDEYRGATLLHYAGSVEMANHLLKLGFSVTDRDNSGQTPLFYFVRFARFDDHELVSWALSQGSDPNSMDNNGRTPLFMLNDSNAVAGPILIEWGADFNLGSLNNENLKVYAERVKNETLLKLVKEEEDFPGTKGAEQADLE